MKTIFRRNLPGGFVLELCRIGQGPEISRRHRRIACPECGRNVAITRDGLDTYRHICTATEPMTVSLNTKPLSQPE
jgi:hypothetical protein